MNSIFLKVLDDKILVEANFGWLNDCANNNDFEKDIYFYHKDHLGSSTQITDRDATVSITSSICHLVSSLPNNAPLGVQVISSTANLSTVTCSTTFCISNSV